LTDHLPKPLVEVCGRTLLDGILDHLDRAGVSKVVVNAHYLGQQIVNHLAARKTPVTDAIVETELLETGGGVANALPHLGADPFYVINGDVLWLDGREPALKRLAEAWDGGKMDGLLLLQPVARAMCYDGAGDFIMNPLGLLRRRDQKEVAPYVFAGVQLLHPRLFETVPQGPFSLNLLYDRALESGRLYGIAHEGKWFHISTPEGLKEAEESFS
ncbi:MAG: nucleotidyltransferase family protein, partial [Rhodospirillaceae bacterium]|nr:nucleotidyltransferase family protein [Rhodospirillaceae bacterium]